MSTILDKLVTILGFETDLSALKRYDQKVRDLRKRADSLATSAGNMGRPLAVAGGIAAGSLRTGR